MKYLIAIVNDKHTRTALDFSTAVINSGHSITRVFFFKKGVHIGSQNHAMNSAWNNFATENSLELILCSAAAQNHNINPSDASKFEIGGLGLYAEAQINCDKVVHFD